MNDTFVSVRFSLHQVLKYLSVAGASHYLQIVRADLALEGALFTSLPADILGGDQV